MKELITNFQIKSFNNCKFAAITFLVFELLLIAISTFIKEILYSYIFSHNFLSFYIYFALVTSLRISFL